MWLCVTVSFYLFQCNDGQVVKHAITINLSPNDEMTITPVKFFVFLMIFLVKETHNSCSHDDIIIVDFHNLICNNTK